MAAEKGQVGVLQPSSLPPASLADRAYHAIRDMIVSLELRPGAVIDERGLMQRLGIGRTPTREALRRLAQERLVEVYPRRGMFVTSVEIRDLASLTEVRSLLESHAARLAAERATDDDLVALESLLDELDARTDLDPSELMALDERIHRQVYRSAHNPFLEAALEEHYVLALRIWYLALDRARELEEAVLGHRELLEAILDGDADRAEETMLRHVLDFGEAMRQVLTGT
ncbi:MAG TPA: GntR family transcriptional regulator [Gaiellaceae bacterium]